MEWGSEVGSWIFTGKRLRPVANDGIVGYRETASQQMPAGFDSLGSIRGCNLMTASRHARRIPPGVLFAALIALLLQPMILPAAEPAQKWLQATAYAIPKETTNQGSGYFSIIYGIDNSMYIGAAKYGVNAFLI